MNKEISAAEAANLKESGESIVFLDVREHDEVAICAIEGALHVPMGEIPERLEQLPKEPTLVVFCHHGMRSQNVIHYLEARGMTNTINLRGGIHAWACEVDPEMQRY
ncbi:rhodanese-like domain-containing protein [Coraliomargarita parva]|uniref:rhodanese-like domain-containing protein n=1 Tax=Coraliomargarita parva TaxID=3014050 RepID=UPI0022B2F4CB|nr:rhodanese-like domain-containing protein [Coraliomargarita parva]